MRSINIHIHNLIIPSESKGIAVIIKGHDKYRKSVNNNSELFAVNKSNFNVSSCTMLPVQCNIYHYYIPLYNCHTSSWDAIVPYRSFIDLAKQGYCNHFVCLSVCVSVFCVSAVLIYIHMHGRIHGTLHGTL